MDDRSSSGKSDASRDVSSETSAGLGSASPASLLAVGTDQMGVQAECPDDPLHQLITG